MNIEILDMPDLTELPEQPTVQRSQPTANVRERETTARDSGLLPAVPGATAGVAEPSSRANGDGAA